MNSVTSFFSYFFPWTLLVWLSALGRVDLRAIGGSGYGGSIVLHPTVLLDKGVDDLLHGQVGDQLVVSQRTPGDRVKMTHSL